MNILIIDDHALFCEGLQLLLSGLSDELGFQVESGVRHLDQEIVDRADLILLDLKTIDSEGVDSLIMAKSMEPAGSIVVVSGENDADVIRQCIDQGAAGFIPKNSSPPVLIAALKLVLAGGIYLPPECFDNRVSAGHTSLSGIDKLTRRQRQAVLLAAKGKSNRSIAQEMNISYGTVKLHLTAAYKELGVSNRTEAVFLLSEWGMTDADLSVDGKDENVVDSINDEMTK